MFLEQVLLQCIEADKPLTVLDLCAAPGGKSTHILSLLNDHTLLVANEVIQQRATVLAENIQKWGYSNVVVTQNDPRDFQRLSNWFDVMVIDAPCSGEGLFRKDERAREEWSPEHVALCAQRQQRIIEDAWPALKQEGVLIYCTCTFSPQENERNLQWLSTRHDVEFIKLSLQHDWNIEEVHFENVIGYRFFPHKIKGEGFFIAAVRKAESSAEVKLTTKKTFIHASKQVSDRLKDWLTIKHEFIMQQNLVLAIPPQHLHAVDFLQQNLHVINKGVAVAELKHDKLIPQHALAISSALQQLAFSRWDVEYDQAIAFLKKENIFEEGKEKGFSLIRHDGLPLGFVNVLDRRANNLYPAAWRIRMNQQLNSSIE